MSDGKFPEEIAVTLYEDSKCSMASLYVDDVIVFNGNHWDFHPECWNLKGDKYLGFLEGTDWNGRWQLRDLLAENLRKKGYNVTVKNQSYTYGKNGRF